MVNLIGFAMTSQHSCCEKCVYTHILVKLVMLEAGAVVVTSFLCGKGYKVERPVNVAYRSAKQDCLTVMNKVGGDLC